MGIKYIIILLLIISPICFAKGGGFSSSRSSSSFSRSSGFRSSSLRNNPSGASKPRYSYSKTSYSKPVNNYHSTYVVYAPLPYRSPSLGIMDWMIIYSVLNMNSHHSSCDGLVLIDNCYYSSDREIQPEPQEESDEEMDTNSLILLSIVVGLSIILLLLLLLTI